MACCVPGGLVQYFFLAELNRPESICSLTTLGSQGYQNNHLKTFMTVSKLYLK